MAGTAVIAGQPEKSSVMSLPEQQYHETGEEKPAVQSSSGWFQLQVPANGSSALIKKIVRHQGDGKAISSSDILKKLKEQNVKHGIDTGAIETLLEQVEANEAPSEPVIIARSEVCEGRDGELDWLIGGITRQDEPVIVAPDVKLAVLKPAVRGSPGKNVFGTLRQPRPVYEPVLRAGEGVRVEEQEDGSFSYLSIFPGLLRFENDTLEVDSGIRISADHMQAHMDIPAGGIHGADVGITLHDILAVLESDGVCQGIKTENIQAVLSSGGKRPALVKDVLVAEGSSAKDGVNAWLDVDDELAVGKINEYGEIDFYEKSYPWNVRAGEVIGRLIPAQPEENGFTVTGRLLKAEPARGINLVLDGLHQDEDGMLRANRDGVLLVSGSAISVTDSLLIEGDVCHRTGNVNSSQTVIVKGYVEPGFSLESKGDVIVEDNVEQSRLRANGDVVVKSGIRGSQTTVITRGSISAGFVENARIKALGDIRIENSLVNCYSYCRGRMDVGSSQSKKSTLIGGTTHVIKGMSANNLGSEGFKKTVIRAGVELEVIQRYRDTDEELDKRKRILDEILLMFRQQKSRSAGSDNKLSAMANTCRMMRMEIEQVKRERQTLYDLLEDSRKVKVIVHQSVYPGVRIEILDKSFEVRKKENAGMFFLEDDLIIFRPSA